MGGLSENSSFPNVFLVNFIFVFVVVIFEAIADELEKTKIEYQKSLEEKKKKLKKLKKNRETMEEAKERMKCNQLFFALLHA